MKFLEIQSLPRCESSDSITLTTSFIEACKSNNTAIVVDTLNVWHDQLPEFDHEAIGAKYKAVKHETMTETESNVWERIQSLIQLSERRSNRLIRQSSSIRAVHVSWRVLLFRPRDSITRQPIWAFGCTLLGSRPSERDCRQRVQSRLPGIRSEPGEGQSRSGTTG